MRRIQRSFAPLFAAFAAGACASLAPPQTDAALHAALTDLNRAGLFDGAVVIRRGDEPGFARGYGLADPFAGVAFTPATPVDSASLAKPVTAAAVLRLAARGQLDLAAPVRRYLPEYPHDSTSVAHLLAHSAGLPSLDAIEPLDGKDNRAVLVELGSLHSSPLFAEGSRFEYCNACYSTLALLVERVSGRDLVSFARSELGLPPGVGVRPRRLADWSGRAVGFRRAGEGSFVRADSYEDEAFYGSANLSVSADQLALWGEQWWTGTLADIRDRATSRASLDGGLSGLTWGSWHCAPGGRRCHYTGHHEGFHNFLFWDSDRRVSLAMVSNNTLDPALQQRLQRALVAFAEGKPGAGRRELAARLEPVPPRPGRYRDRDGRTVESDGEGRNPLRVTQGGVAYSGYPVASGLWYVPGLDAYLAGRPGKDGLRWLTIDRDDELRRER